MELARVNLEAKLIYRDGLVDMCLSVLPKGNSKIHTLRLLTADDEPDDFSEIQGCRRVSRLDMTATQTHAFVRIMAPLLWELGLHRPLLLICGPGHANAWCSIWRREGFQAEILRGSHRKNNPYSLLKMSWGIMGGSDDEHILRVEKKNDG